MTQYFYVPGAYSVLEQAELIDGIYTGRDSGDSFDKIKANFPAVVVLPLERCIDAIREAAKLPVQRISEETFRLFRESAIMDLQQTSEGTTFKCREFFAVDIITIFAALTINRETHCFTFRDVETLDHNQIITRALDSRLVIPEHV